MAGRSEQQAEEQEEAEEQEDQEVHGKFRGNYLRTYGRQKKQAATSEACQDVIYLTDQEEYKRERERRSLLP